MDGLAVADLRSVVAPLNFLVPMAEKPIAYNYEPPPGTPVRTGQSVTHHVPIRDARPLIGQLSLYKEGFVLLRHQTAVTNFYDEEQIKSVYYVRRDKAALFQWVQGPPGDRSRRKQPGQAWR